jgi:hypothetical protein
LKNNLVLSSDTRHSRKVAYSLYFTFKTGFKQEAAEALAAKLVQLFNEKVEANSKPLTTEEVIEAMDIKGVKNYTTLKNGLVRNV